MIVIPIEIDQFIIINKPIDTQIITIDLSGFDSVSLSNIALDVNSFE